MATIPTIMHGASRPETLQVALSSPEVAPSPLPAGFPAVHRNGSFPPPIVERASAYVIQYGVILFLQLLFPFFFLFGGTLVD